MISKRLAINEVYAANHPVVYTCYGLGSCIGLFVTDRLSNLSGGAHIPLPRPDTGEFRDAVSLIGQLLALFDQLGSDLTCLRAKVAGGANVLKSYHGVGEQNVRAVMQCLTDRRIFIAATDVGGDVSRTARFNSTTGELHISTSEQKIYCI